MRIHQVFDLCNCCVDYIAHTPFSYCLTYVITVSLLYRRFCVCDCVCNSVFCVRVPPFVAVIDSAAASIVNMRECVCENVFMKF